MTITHQGSGAGKRQHRGFVHMQQPARQAPAQRTPLSHTLTPLCAESTDLARIGRHPHDDADAARAVDPLAQTCSTPRDSGVRLK